VFAGTAGITAFLPNIYRSTATVLVERHQVSETFVRSSVTSELETRLQTIGQEVLSRARLEGLITRFSLYPDMRSKAPMEAIVEKMRRDIRLEFKGAEQMSGRTATVAFNLSYRGRDPETVAQVANTLASFYVEENSKIRERQASQTTQFLKVQLEATKARLDEQEARVRNFRARHLGELPRDPRATPGPASPEQHESAPREGSAGGPAQAADRVGHERRGRRLRIRETHQAEARAGGAAYALQ